MAVTLSPEQLELLEELPDEVVCLIVEGLRDGRAHPGEIHLVLTVDHAGHVDPARTHLTPTRRRPRKRLTPAHGEGYPTSEL